MAPFKLKFRMGSSRSTSQEHDPDPQVNEALLANNHSTAIGASNSTIDSADCTSLGSLGTNERKSLLPPHKTNNLRLGYLNPNITQCNVNSTSAATAAASPTAAARVPQTPPPSYEHVLEENTRLGNNFDLYTPQRQSSSGDEHNNTQQQQQQQQEHSRRSSVNNLRNSLHLSPIEGGIPQCTDPDCLENLANEQHQQAVAAQRIYDYNAGNSSNNNEQRHHQQQQRERQRQEIENDYEHRHNDNNGGAQLAVPELDLDDVDENDGEDDNEDIESDDNRKESIDSTELLISTNMTAPSSHENLLDNCNGECQHGSQYCGGRGSGNGDNDGESDFCDPLMNHNGYCVNDNHHYSNDDCQYEQHSQNQAPPEYTDRRSDTDSEDGGGCGGSWNTTQMSNDYQHHHLQQQQQQQQQQMEQQHYQQQQELRSQTPEIISNKSSKEIYKDLAKQWGITCKMSDGCRCMECQSHYFDCEYNEVSPDNEQQKTDGGLGAGTPMFISEVMHGSACTIL